MLQHVLDAMADAGVGDVVVVLGDDAAAIEGAIDWRGERRVVNPDPGVGWRARSRSGSRRFRRRPRPMLVALGDQPLVSAAVIEALLDAAGRPGPADRHADL